MPLAKDALWANGHDETVEVNQRALIDKVLARYSGEFTVFRELLQNSDDAQSTEVEIRFETQRFIDRRNGKQMEHTGAQGEQETLPDLKTTLVHQWTFRNNGRHFKEEDWSRLKKIAEGNPDEEKIGAFGVGFYSLFSVTEEPFVRSGGQWMGFYWKDKKDQLFARRGELTDSDESAQNIWTSFEMTLRAPAPIPTAFNFTRFLASSITFMTHISEVRVYFDEIRLTKLTKSFGNPNDLVIPKGLQRCSGLGIMNIKRVKSTPLHIKAETMPVLGTSEVPQSNEPITKHSGHNNRFFSIVRGFLRRATQKHTTPHSAIPTAKIDPLTTSENSLTLSIISADVDVHLDKRLTGELHRCMKKNPPSKLKYELIFTSKNEYDASKQEEQSAVSGVFQGLRADLDGTGSAHIFIGHTTSQTTGVGGHMESRFIPTVERESIDLVDQNVAIWNRELLYVGGFLARCVYETALTKIRNDWEEAISAPALTPDQNLQMSLRAQSLHAMRFFTFRPSTPSAEISSLIEAAFYSCTGNNQFPIMSTVGVRDVSEVRIPDAACSGFIKQLPMVPSDILLNARLMVTSLQNRGLIKTVAFEDIMWELRSRPLGEDEMVAFLKWWLGLKEQGGSPERTQLLHAATLVVGSLGASNQKIISLQLASVKTFISGKGTGVHIPLDGPLPDHLLPVTISSQLPTDSLLSSFPWTDLTITEWLRHVCSPAGGAPDARWDINLSASWAERVLTVLVRSWPSFSNPATVAEIAGLLKEKTCIPTSAGLKLPEHSYFPNANVFQDLPIVTFPSGMPIKGPLERLLQNLGVQKHVDLQLIFNRMIETGHWTTADLTKYLVSIQSTLTTEEWAHLKEAAAFFKESNVNEQEERRYQAKCLYEPLDIFRQLRLPILDWGTRTKWLGTSEEAMFLFELGLVRLPPLTVIVDLCASPHLSVHSIALEYLLDNIGTQYKGFDTMNFPDVAFIPALRGDAPCLGTPKEVFSAPDWAALGFLVVNPSLQQDAQAKLKVKNHPPPSQLVSFLETTPPKDESEACKWFGILAGRILDFSSTERRRLSQLPIVPTKTQEYKGENSVPLRWLPPSHCFFEGGTKSRLHSMIFAFVDFGPPANDFLHACGTKKEPSVEDIAQKLLADPHKFYELADGPHNFLAELRKIAVNHDDLSPSTRERMRESPILLGSRPKLQNNGTKGTVSGDFDDDDEWDLQFDLKLPDQIVIVDDINAHQFFRDSLFTAPQEDILEEFYAKLGSRHLSSLIKEDYQTSHEIASPDTMKIRALILERLPLLLLEPSHARAEVSYVWLKSESNFVVKSFGKLSVTKTLNHGDVRLCRNHYASAVAKRIASGPIQLCLLGNAKVDMYEVATSMCRLLFDVPKINDALLFMTFLSTDLRSLKRKGYNVDRILRQQKKEKQAAEEAKAKADAVSKALREAPKIQEPPPLLPSASVVVQKTQHPDKPRSSVTGLPPTESGSADLPIANKPSVSTMGNISLNIEIAIKACRPERGNLVQIREEMQQVKESLKEGYCDISGRIGSLNIVGEIEGVKVFVSQDVPEPQSFVARKHNSLARFNRILVPLAQVYGFLPTSLHVFYDLVGDLIAFNKDTAIFINLRYFEERHDEDVLNDTTGPAYISWYFTLAHEIAHNLVQSHDSEHEFYFSAICEKHLMGLGKLLFGP